MTTHDHELESQLWELVYDLLSLDEAAALRKRIDSDPDVAQAYERVRSETRLVARAAQVEHPRITLPELADRPSAISRGFSARTSRWMNVLLYAAASTLIGLAAYTYYRADSPVNSHRLADARRALAHEYVRTIVVAPSRWKPTATNTVSVTTMSADGTGQSARLEYRFSDADGNVLIDREIQTDSTGRYFISVPGQIVTDHAKLEVWPPSRQRLPLSCPVYLSDHKHVTRLTTDKPIYQPGERVFYRSLTLSRFDFTADTELPMEFHVLDPGGSEVPQSRQGGITIKGVGHGNLMIPPMAPGGRYTLVATNLDHRAPEARCHFDVRQYRAPRFKKELEFARDSYGPGDTVVADFQAERAEGGPLAFAAVKVAAALDGMSIVEQQRATNDDGTLQVQFDLPETIEKGLGQLVLTADNGGTRETIVKTIPVNLGRVHVDFYPEGGYLVPELENRVYFEATDPQGKPVDILGAVVNASGETVAELSTVHQGRGAFRYTPRGNTTYEVKLERPPNAELVGNLPTANSETGIVIDTGSGVFDESAPIRLKIRSRQSGTPIVVSAACWGASVGASSFMTSASQPVTLDLPLIREAEGVVRVTAFDYSQSPPDPVAERLVYRRPQRKLSVTFDKPQPQTDLAPGGNVELGLSVTDERGEPVAAALGVSVVDDAVLSLVEKQPGIETYFRLLTNLDEPRDLEQADLFLADNEASEQSLDLLLGTRGWRRFAPAEPPAEIELNFAEQPAEATNESLAETESHDKLWPVVPPTVNDDVAQVRANYAEAAHSLFDRQRSLRSSSLATLFGASIVVLTLTWIATRRSYTTRRAGAVLAGAGGSCLALSLVWLSASPAWEAPRTVAGFARYTTSPPQRVAPDSDALALAQSTLSTERSRFDRFDDYGYNAKMFFATPGLYGWEYTPPQARFEGAYYRPDLAGYELPDTWAVPRFALGFEPPQFPMRLYAHSRQSNLEDGRHDFTETLYWNPLLLADSEGHATLRFELPDSITEFRVLAEGHAAGRIGAGEDHIASRLPFNLALKLPYQVTAGDIIHLPVAVNNNSSESLTVKYSIDVGTNLSLEGDPDRQHAVGPAQRYRDFHTVRAAGTSNESKIRVIAAADPFHDELLGHVVILPAGFPVAHSYAGNIDGEQEVVVDLPPDLIAGSLEVALQAFPSPLADLQQGVKGLLREPSGCFEQTSSATYPNILSLQFMQQHQVADPEYTRRAKSLLSDGYDRLVGFQCTDQGYEWFGQDPGHEALTAYGLMEFHDMQGVCDVDAEMVSRSSNWLLKRRDGQGGFQRNEKALDQFGRAPKEITDAYIVWALTESGQSDLHRELDATVNAARQSDDPYLIALAAGAAMNVDHRRDDGRRLLDRLAELQAAGGDLAATRGTITRSGGASLQVETTALAALAWLKSKPHEAAANRAISWITRNRQGSGTFGSTQATILALKALIANAEAHRRDVRQGALVLTSDGVEIGRTDFSAGEMKPIQMTGIEGELRPGRNQLHVSLTGDNQMPYVLDIQYRTPKPDSHPDCAVQLATELAETKVPAGSAVDLAVTVENVSDRGVPMVTAIIGLPAGLEARTDQLDELKEAGHFDYYEINRNELVFYWRSMSPDARGAAAPAFTLNLIAEIPGQYTGPASRVYLYYTSEQKHWAQPLAIEIEIEK